MQPEVRVLVDHRGDCQRQTGARQDWKPGCRAAGSLSRLCCVMARCPRRTLLVAATDTESVGHIEAINVENKKHGGVMIMMVGMFMQTRK